ncbi:MAG: hypothetical protein HY544_01475 [Candidatus Diapherotrites archaeon]|uniref:Uncharacterized protein n=1 Tax=Candidatus Iainarchaeum sp. TaxID=3101447 RepID=A0A8T3YK42_9ARCH|nr:hypothetical protein [Candidatus Diapherotrites archaeon]
MDEPIILPIGDDELERRLLEIRQKHDINATLLVNLLKSQEFTRLASQGLGKHAMRRARRTLTGSSATFGFLSEIIERHKASLAARHDDYTNSILSKLDPKQRDAYQTGNWTPEILEAVSTAQRKHFPKRPPSPAEIEKRVTFKPHGQYRRRWNR